MSPSLQVGVRRRILPWVMHPFQSNTPTHLTHSVNSVDGASARKAAARGALASRLIDSLQDGEVDPDAEVAWEAEISQRLKGDSMARLFDLATQRRVVELVLPEAVDQIEDCQMVGTHPGPPRYPRRPRKE